MKKINTNKIEHCKIVFVKVESNVPRNIWKR